MVWLAAEGMWMNFSGSRGWTISAKGTMDSTRELQRVLQWPVLGAIPRIQKIPSVKLKHENAGFLEGWHGVGTPTVTANLESSGG